MTTVGIFEIEPILSDKWLDKWRVLNTVTKIQYATFGTEDEVTALLLQQTPMWELKRDIALGIVKPKYGKNGSRRGANTSFNRIPQRRRIEEA